MSNKSKNGMQAWNVPVCVTNVCMHAHMHSIRHRACTQGWSIMFIWIFSRVSATLLEKHR